MHNSESVADYLYIANIGQLGQEWTNIFHVSANQVYEQGNISYLSLKVKGQRLKNTNLDLKCHKKELQIGSGLI